LEPLSLKIDGHLVSSRHVGARSEVIDLFPSLEHGRCHFPKKIGKARSVSDLLHPDCGTPAASVLSEWIENPIAADRSERRLRCSHEGGAAWHGPCSWPERDRSNLIDFK